MNRHYIATIVALAGTATFSLAQSTTTTEKKEKTEKTEKRQPADETRREMKRHSESEEVKEGCILVPSTRAEGVNVIDSEGTTIGRVQDTIVRGTSGRVVYVLVTRGVPPAYSPTTGRVVAVPFAALNWDDDRKVLALNMTETQFNAATSMEVDQWRSLGEPARAITTYKYFQIPDNRATEDRKEYTYKRTTSADGHKTEVKEETKETKKVKPADDRRASNDDGAVTRVDQEGSLFRVGEIRNKPVLARDGKSIGLVNDIVFDAPSGRIAFLVVTPDASLNAGDGRVGIPWPSFEVDQSGRLFARDIDAETLRSSPRLTQAEWAELQINGYTNDMYTRYGYEGSTWKHTKVTKTSTTTETTREDKMSNSKNRDQYRAAYAAGTPRTIKGKIESAETAAAANGMPAVVVMKVKTDDGETVSVHTAPKSYLVDHKCDLHKGDAVVITGRTVDFNGKQCIVATDVVASDGNRVVLHSTEGDPTWPY